MNILKLIVFLYLICLLLVSIEPKIFIEKVEISDCLLFCPIITQEPLDRFASNFNWGTRETHRNVLSLVLRFLIEWEDFNCEVNRKTVQVQV